MVFGADYKTELKNAFRISKQIRYNNQLYFNGWMTNIPINMIEFNSFESFTNDFGIFVSKKHSNLLVDLVSENFRDHNRGRVKAKKVTDIEGYEIIEFELVD